MGMERYKLRQMVGRLTSEMRMGTPSGGFALNTFQSEELADIYSDGFFTDWWLRFYAGTHKDKTARVTDFLDAHGFFTFKPDLATNVDASSLFEVHKDFTPEEINDAINLSISMVEDVALQDKLDESLTIIADTYEYTIPANFLFLDKIFQESSTSGLYPPAELIDNKHWQILRGPTPKIWFDDGFVSLTTGRKLRLVGQQVQAQLALDADTCDINPAFIVYQAKALLHQSRIRGEGADFQEHRSQLGMAQGLADRERKAIRVSPRGRKVSH